MIANSPLMWSDMFAVVNWVPLGGLLAGQKLGAGGGQL